MPSWGGKTFVDVDCSVFGGPFSVDNQKVQIFSLQVFPPSVIIFVVDVHATLDLILLLSTSN